MNTLPTQQSLLDLHKKLKNPTYKGKENKAVDNNDVLPNCEKSEKSEERVAVSPELMETYQAVLRRVRYCQRSSGDVDRFKKGRERLMRVLAREYLPALKQLEGQYSREALESECAIIEQRLERGWQMDDTDSVARTFSRLLTQYEIISDLLAGDVINRMMARAERAAGHA